MALAIAIAVLAPLIGRKEEAINTNTATLGNTNSRFPAGVSVNTSQEIEDRPVITTREASTQSTLFAIATTFAEKYGSYSNEANYENLEDIKVFMTPSLQAWVDENAREEQSRGDTYFGVTTRALRSEIISLNNEETQAQVLVTVQQEESRGSVGSSGRILYKGLLLDFVLLDDAWKVNAVSWQ